MQYVRESVDLHGASPFVGMSRPGLLSSTGRSGLAEQSGRRGRVQGVNRRIRLITRFAPLDNFPAVALGLVHLKSLGFRVQAIVTEQQQRFEYEPAHEESPGDIGATMARGWGRTRGQLRVRPRNCRAYRPFANG
jgi:hypothetical protein